MQFGPLMSFWMVNGVCAMIPEEAAGNGRFFFFFKNRGLSRKTIQ